MNERYVIHVTKLCNLDCKYCYEKDKTSLYTENEVIKFAEEIIKTSNGNKFGIEFLGGEPMLAFDIIKKCYEFFEEKCGAQISDYVITTNGTILTDEMIDYISKNNKIIYAVSLDGNKWANQLRVFKNSQENSYEQVVINLKKAISVFSNNRTTVHMVTHKYNVGNLYDSVKHLAKLGIKYIGIGTVESTMIIDDWYCKTFVKEMAKVSEAIKNKKIKVNVDILEYQKPKTDIRTYIRDDNGKTIGETYGRVQNDITGSEKYNSIRTSSPLEDIIYNIRACVYKNHQLIMRGNNDYK